MNNNETMWSTEITHEGMSLRDYFAAQVIQGMYANSNQYNTSYHTAEWKAKTAYELADAMLKAREQ